MTSPSRSELLITSTELQKLLDTVGWSGLRLAKEVAVYPSTVYNWLHGRAQVPGAVVAYLRLILRTRAIVKQLGVSDE